MSKIYKIRLSNSEHRRVQIFCDAINAHRPTDLPSWEPENAARFLVLRAIELFEEDLNVLNRFLSRARL